jgi:predicted glycosyltransferase
VDGLTTAGETQSGRGDGQATPPPLEGGGGAGLASPRFLLYSHDALGLGHVRRNLVIAAALTEHCPGASVILATSAEHADSLGVPDGVDLMRLPAVRKVDNGRYTPRRLPISHSDLTALREGILATAVERYRPDVLLVDRHPLGVDDELRPALGRLRELGGRAVLGLRDVLDEPAAVRSEWTFERTQTVLRHFGRVLVYGSDDVFDTLRSSGLPSQLASRARYCGYVTSAISDDVAAGRSIRGFAGRRRQRPLVLATSGGGEDGRQLLETFVAAAAEAEWDSIAVAGPQLRERDAVELRRRAAAAGVPLRTFVPDLSGWFGVVDGLVCMGGYNTLGEALVRGTPTVCVPRITPRREQLIRARALARLRLLEVVEPQRLDAATLGAAIGRALRRRRSWIARAARQALPFDGAEIAAEQLLAEAALSKTATGPVLATAVGAS